MGGRRRGQELEGSTVNVVGRARNDDGRERGRQAKRGEGGGIGGVGMWGGGGEGGGVIMCRFHGEPFGGGPS